MSDMRQNLLLCAVAAIGLAACTKDELADDTRLPEGQYPLEIAAVTLSVEGGEAQPWGAPQTRVSENADGTGSVWDWDGFERIGVQLGGETTAYTLRSDHTLELDGFPLYWTSAAPNQPVTAWYPSAEDGSLDLRDQETNGLAYLLHGTGTGDYRTPVTLTFTHSLAKVRVTLSDALGDGEVTSLQLYTYTRCTYEKGKVVQGTDEGWIEMKPCEYNGVTCWEANVVPGYEITKLRANGTEERDLSAAINPGAGNFYNISLGKGPGYLYDEDTHTYHVYTADGLLVWNEKVQQDMTLNCLLTGNINLSGKEWKPVGSTSKRYTGTFDGGNHTITGLTVNKPTETHVGMFGYVDTDGEVRNLRLDNVLIAGTGTVGGVAAAHKGTITNCSINGTVKGESSVGGIAGTCIEGTIANSSSEGSVTGTEGYVGGIGGNCWGMTFTNCHSSATVQAESSVGGIVGYQNLSVLTACHSSGSVTATRAGDAYVGGVVGLSDGGSILACYATGNVTATAGGCVGGVVGSNALDGSIIACYHATGTVSGSTPVGGVLGKNQVVAEFSCIVTACYWQNDQSQGIGEDQTGNGDTTKVTSSDWTAAMNAMNAALSGTGWQYAPGSSDAPLTLVKQ